jgi:hypothetical protein
MKKYFSKGFLVLGFLALSTSMFAIQVTIKCGNGNGTTYISDSDDLGTTLQQAAEVMDAIC